ncbi:Tn3 family transposase [Microbispora sp. NEAU-D428]|nr:Tn3 family transposase [Microbispora sitophila]MBE3011835.1 Tn3 family transposase [Microbispora sitophila]
MTGRRPRCNVAALTRARLQQVDQGYLRAETIAAANARLLAAQADIGLVAAWGGGQIALADGLRFVVPVANLHTGHNPIHFGRQRGATWLNVVNDQVMGIGGLVVLGTLRDSLFILDAIHTLDGGPRPETVITDTASYSDIVFGLFAICGYQFSPRIADLATPGCGAPTPARPTARWTTRAATPSVWTRFARTGRHAPRGRLADHRRRTGLRPDSDAVDRSASRSPNRPPVSCSRTASRACRPIPTSSSLSSRYRRRLPARAAGPVLRGWLVRLMLP